MTEYVRLLVKNKKSSTERKNTKYLQEHKKKENPWLISKIFHCNKKNPVKLGLFYFMSAIYGVTVKWHN